MPSPPLGSPGGQPFPSSGTFLAEADHAREQIERMLVGDALTIAFQPVVDIRSGEVVGAEALARFNSEPRRTPDLWFKEAWSVGLGLELELEAILRALSLLGGMPPGTYVAVNAAPATLCSDALLQLLGTVPTERVIVELTEHDRVDDYDALTNAIARLRARGARLSVDDAGAGFASFQHVLRLRPDIIKLDRSLTTKVDENPVRASLAAALVTFGGSLGASICAEGIETVGELVALQKLGIMYGQGYLFARPAPLPIGPVPTGVWTSPRPSRSIVNGFLASPAVRSAERLEALDQTGLMDSEPEEAFDRFTRLVRKLLGVPTALVSLLDDRRQFFKSAAGLGEPWATARETPLTHSFCQHAVTTRLPLVIEDARSHPLVHDNAAVSALGVVAYVGVPIILADGQALGSLCAIDTTPRAWTAEEIASLQDLTAMLVSQIELGLARRDRRERHALFRCIFDQTDAAVVLCGVDGRIEHVSNRLCDLLGYVEGELRGRPFVSLEQPEDVVPALSTHSHVLAGGQREAREEKRLLCKDGRRLRTRTTTSVIRDNSDQARFTIVTVEPAEVR
jgi:PAS domain S-box-containing protein